MAQVNLASKLIMAENWKTNGELTVLGTRFGVDRIPELRAKIGIVGSFRCRTV